MKSQAIVLVVFVLGYVNHIDAFPSGASEAQCAAMMPFHGVLAQTSASPYMITVDGDNYYRAGQMKKSMFCLMALFVPEEL